MNQVQFNSLDSNLRREVRLTSRRPTSVRIPPAKIARKTLHELAEHEFGPSIVEKRLLEAINEHVLSGSGLRW